MIAHLSSQLSGGGAIAARRLHDALHRSGAASRFYFGTGYTNDPSYQPLFQNGSFSRRNLAALLTSWQNRRQAPYGHIMSPGWISPTVFGGLGANPAVVNLHDVDRWLDQPSFFKSLPVGLPVVWSLHVLLPITGGCIYTGDCDGFTKRCGNCPQLEQPGTRDVTRKYFDFKQRWYDQLNLHLVGNSEWTTAQINRSALCQHAKSVRTIHYGINIDQFKPVNKRVAREALGLGQDKFVVGFACTDFQERRKGAHLLMEALKAMPAKDVLLVVFGGGLWPRNAAPCETITLGSIGSPRLQSVFYSALDVFAMPTQVETFGLVAAEAMACETPVVAYPGGGLADVVVDQETGLMGSEFGDVDGLAKRLRWMWQHPKERLGMGIAGRQRVVEKFSDALMAKNYGKLYEELAPGVNFSRVETVSRPPTGVPASDS